MKHATCPFCGNPLHFEAGFCGDALEPPSVDFWYCDHCDYESVDDPYEQAVSAAESRWDDDHGH